MDKLKCVELTGKATLSTTTCFKQNPMRWNLRSTSSVTQKYGICHLCSWCVKSSLLSQVTGMWLSGTCLWPEASTGLCKIIKWTWDVIFSGWARRVSHSLLNQHLSLLIFRRMSMQKRFFIVAALIWAMITCCSNCKFKSTISSGVHCHRLRCSTYQKFAHDQQNLHHKISQSKKAKTLRQSQQPV